MPEPNTAFISLGTFPDAANNTDAIKQEERQTDKITYGQYEEGTVHFQRIKIFCVIG